MNTSLLARMAEALRQADAALHLCSAQAGTPDAGDGCRLIIQTVERCRPKIREALAEYAAMTGENGDG